MKANFVKNIEEMGSKAKPLLRYYLEVLSKEDNSDADRFIHGWSCFQDGNFNGVIETFSDDIDTFKSLNYKIKAASILMIVHHIKKETDKAMIYYLYLKDNIESLSRNIEYEAKLQLSWFEMFVLKDYKRIEKLKANKNHYYSSYNFYYKAYLELEINKNFDKGILYLKKAYELINDCNRPSHKLMILNLEAYHLYLNGRVSEAASLADKIEFNIGYWIDDSELKSWIPTLDTLIDIKRSPELSLLFLDILTSSCDKRSNYAAKAENIKKMIHSQEENYINKHLEEIICQKIEKIPLIYHISQIKSFSNNNLIEQRISFRITNPEHEMIIEKARRELAEMFVSFFDNPDKLEDYYFSLSDKDKIYMEKFILNYSRYLSYDKNIKSLQQKGSYCLNFFDKSPLDPFIATVVLYIWNKDEREYAANIIENMVKFCSE